MLLSAHLGRGFHRHPSVLPLLAAPRHATCGDLVNTSFAIGAVESDAELAGDMPDSAHGSDAVARFVESR